MTEMSSLVSSARDAKCPARYVLVMPIARIIHPVHEVVALRRMGKAFAGIKQLTKKG